MVGLRYFLILEIRVGFLLFVSDFVGNLMIIAN